MRSGTLLLGWSLSVAWLGADAFIQPQHHAAHRRVVYRSSKALFSQPEDRYVVCVVVLVSLVWCVMDLGATLGRYVI